MRACNPRCFGTAAKFSLRERLCVNLTAQFCPWDNGDVKSHAFFSRGLRKQLVTLTRRGWLAGLGPGQPLDGAVIPPNQAGTCTGDPRYCTRSYGGEGYSPLAGRVNSLSKTLLVYNQNDKLNGSLQSE